MTLFFIKIFVTAAIVLALSITAERLSPRWAGVLGGFPLSVAIVLIFIAIEEGAAFGAESAVHTIAGLTANLSIFATYGLLLIYNRMLAFYICVPVALCAFFAVGYGLSLIDFTMFSAVAFISVILVLATIGFNKFQDHKIEKAVKLSFWVIGVRAASACAVVVIITALAETLGPKMAGVLASFPATVLPMVVIIHATYGASPVHAILQHFPLGLIATVVFCISFAFLILPLGTLWGTILSFALSFVYLGAYSKIKQKRS